jgi:hypothetical protein
MNTADHHLYSLDHLEGNGHETLQFVEKEKCAEDGTMKLVKMGTTNEQVLEVVIDRIEAMDKKFPCIENNVALSNLRVALGNLNERTRQRRLRGVEGKALA